MAAELPYTRKEAKSWAMKNVVDWYECPLTPVTDDFKFDEDGMRENLEAYVEMGETGLVVGGFLSEAWSVTLDDWKRYHKVLAEANRGRLPLWTIILDPSVHQSLEKMKYVQDLGYVGAEVINPVVQLKTDDEIYNYFKYMTDQSDLAICLYHTRVSGRLLSLDLVKRLADIDTIIGLKQGSGNHGDSLVMRKAVRNDFLVSDPLEDYWLDDLRNGGQVLWGYFVHIIYGKKRWMLEEYTKLAREGNWEEAYKVSEGLKPVREFLFKVFAEPLFRTASYATSLANIKAWYEAIGLKAGPMIPPVQALSTKEKEYIKSELQRIGVA